MADSTMAVDPNDITDLVTGEANDPDVVDANIGVVVTAYNASLETATGHDHDGTNSKLLATGVTGWDSDDILLGVYSGRV